jgi:hypothetical protein
MNSTRFIFSKVILIFIACSFSGTVIAQSNGKSETDSLLIVAKGNEPGGENVFSSDFPTTDMQEFEAFAKQMARLKPFGKIETRINYVAEEASFEMPEGGSPWHEYASNNGPVHLFFPDEKLAPFLPADLVKKNQQLLLSKVAVLRKMGFEATWDSKDPHFLPEAFFEKYPNMRGPRVDHPRRSLHRVCWVPHGLFAG